MKSISSTQITRPVIFSGPMVRAILEDRKTQTRRIINPQPQPFHDNSLIWKGDVFWQNGSIILDEDNNSPCPYGVAGDRLWVRETWGTINSLDAVKPRNLPHIPMIYRASSAHPNARHQLWRPSIHMPRWASRITLEITKVRVERLNDISEEDAKAEGVAKGIITADGNCLIKEERGLATYRQGFEWTWDSLHGKGAWDKNPWVWVIEFKRDLCGNVTESGGKA